MIRSIRAGVYGQSLSTSLVDRDSQDDVQFQCAHRRVSMRHPKTLPSECPSRLSRAEEKPDVALSNVHGLQRECPKVR